MDHMHEWIVKATAAGFLPFELTDPAPDEYSLGGCGWGSGSRGPLHVDFTYLVDGRELMIGTATGVSDDFEILDSRRTVLDVLEAMLEEPLVFPLTLTARFELRTIEVAVDGKPVAFQGIVSEGTDGWTLRARVDRDTIVTIGGTGDVIPVAIRRRNHLSIQSLLGVH